MGNLCFEPSQPATSSTPASRSQAEYVEFDGGVNSFEIEERSQPAPSDRHPVSPTSFPSLDDETSGSEKVYKLSKRQEDSCEEIFSVFEDDEDKVHIQHLGPMMRAINKATSHDEIENTRKNFLTKNPEDDRMTFEQFLHLIRPHIMKAHELYSEERIEAAFRRFDVDGNGFISASELRIALRENFCEGMNRVAEAITDDDMEEIMHEADLDGDGKINFLEFSRMIPNLGHFLHVSTKVK